MSTGAEEHLVSSMPGDAARERVWLRVLPAIAIALTLFRFRLKIFLTPLPLNDFMIYWSGARLLLAHANPYSAEAITSLERSLGWTLQPHMLLNPPWSFPLFAWLGLFPFGAVHAACRLLAIGIECFSAVLLWRYFGGERKHWWVSLAILATFLPAGSAEQMGQITIPMLAALTAWLFLTRNRQYFAAGLVLLVLAAKPHLLLLLLAAIVLWCVQQQNWSMLAGAAVAVGLSTAAVAGFNPLVLAYLHGSTQPAIETLCGVGGVLREMFGMQHGWLQFVPTAVGFVWLAVHWGRHRHAWHWEQQAPVLLLASLAAAPYSWAHDYVLALPTIIALSVKLYKSTSDWVLPAAMYLAVQIVIFAYLQDAPKPVQSLGCVLWLVLYTVASPRTTAETLSMDAVAQAA
jgi:hypothetical protein